MLRALFVLEMFTFLSWLIVYLEKRLDKKSKVNFKIYGVTDWTTNHSEALIQRFSVRKVFLEISQDSQENTLARVFFRP